MDDSHLIYLPENGSLRKKNPEWLSLDEVARTEFWNSLNADDREQIISEMIQATAFAVLKDGFKAVYEQVKNDDNRLKTLLAAMEVPIRAVVDEHVPKSPDGGNNQRVFDHNKFEQANKSQLNKLVGERVKQAVEAGLAKQKKDESAARTGGLSRGTDLYYQIAVCVTRASGRRLVFPLWLVETFQAGDVALEDGDRVELIHYSRTALLRDGQQLSAVSAGVQDSLNAFVDVLRVTAVSADGKLEEHFVPRVENHAFSDNSDFGWVLAQAKYSEVTPVHLEVLDLVDVVREGRRLAILRSADSLKIKSNLEKLEAEHRQLEKKLQDIPLIGDACNLIESTTGFDSTRMLSDAYRGVQGTCEALTGSR